jgi:predicted 3-demethylubiquinone-9 3-methyltransferase (glyoxalase superfamily)
MAKVVQVLWFASDMEAALRRYTSLIPNSSIDWHNSLPAESPSGPPDSVKISGFTLGGQNYMAMQATPFDEFGHRMSISVECETQEELDRIYDGLLEGGQAQPCGWLKDRWGVPWQVIPKRLGELMMDPDRKKAKRVAEAMLQMVKIDTAALEAAARG